MKRHAVQETMSQKRLPAALGFICLCLTPAFATGEAAAATLRIASVEPTMFYVRQNGELRQVVDVTVENDGAAVEGSLQIKFGAAQTVAELGKLKKGKATVQAHIPDVRQQTPVEFVLRADGRAVDSHKMTWQPGRHWEVYFVPVTHHDLGYTDTLENVLRKYEGFYDDILRFCAETDDWQIGRAHV